MQNAPKPTDNRVRIVELPEQYFGVISYSGLSDSNFNKHHAELRAVLLNDGLVIVGPPIKATYNYLHYRFSDGMRQCIN